MRDVMSNIARRLRRDKKLLAVLIIGFSAMLLLLISELTDKAEKPSPDETQASAQTEAEEYSYAADTEKRLRELIGSVEGVGKTEVMVTLENGVEQVYATNVSNSDSTSVSQGESRSESGSDREYIVLDSSSGDNALIIKVIQPKIRGVAVVCEGADSPTVKMNVTETVAAVLDIGTSDISVVPMKK